MDAALAPLRFQGIRVLNYIDNWLIFGSITGAGDSALRCRSCPHPKPGVETQHEKKCVGTSLENHVPGSGVDSVTMQAQLSPAWIKSILATVTRTKLGQGITVKHFQRVFL